MHMQISHILKQDLFNTQNTLYERYHHCSNRNSSSFYTAYISSINDIDYRISYSTNSGYSCSSLPLPIRIKINGIPLFVIEYNYGFNNQLHDYYAAVRNKVIAEEKEKLENDKANIIQSLFPE